MKVKIKGYTVSANIAAKENGQFIVKKYKETFYGISSREAFKRAVNTIKSANSTVLDITTEEIKKIYNINPEIVVEYGEEDKKNEKN